MATFNLQCWYYGTCKYYVISTVTYYALTSELWLPETFVITLSVKVVPEMQLILLLEWKSHKFTPCCTNYEVCVGFMRHVNTTL